MPVKLAFESKNLEKELIDQQKICLANNVYMTVEGDIIRNKLNLERYVDHSSVQSFLFCFVFVGDCLLFKIKI